MVKCIAIVEHPKQRDNLCECIRILGGTPCVNKDSVSVSLSSDNPQTEKFIDLFEHYVRYEIQYV